MAPTLDPEARLQSTRAVLQCHPVFEAGLAGRIDRQAGPMTWALERYVPFTKAIT